MRKFLFLIAFLIASGLTGQMTNEARATCTHLGGVVNCPVGITNGSNSLTINADNTITWTGGQVSNGGCCPADAGTSTGAGLRNLNNTLGGNDFHFGPVVRSVTPDPYGAPGDPLATGAVVLSGLGFRDESCSDGRCSGGIAGTLYGAAPGDGYVCDGAAACGGGLWTPPVTGFGQCSGAGCGSPAPLALLDPAGIPGAGRYASNQTTGNFDPFGGAGGFFVDPATGKSEEISRNPAEWSDRIKHADALNTAYINFEIEYPFNDPNWASRSIEDFKKNPPKPTAPSFGPVPAYVPEFGLTESGRVFGATVVSTLRPNAGAVTPFTGAALQQQTNQTRGGGQPLTIETIKGEKNTVRVTDPQTGRTASFDNDDDASRFQSGVNNGVPWDRALAEITAGTPGSAPGASSPATTGSATANSGGVRTPTVPRPARPAGESVTFLEQAPVNGQIFRIEIVRTPDGRTLAVGTGDAAGHVFGEAKQSRSGFWRNEGRWTPPPAPAPIAANNRPAIIVSPATTPTAPQNAPAVGEGTLSVPLVENGITGRTGTERGSPSAKASGQFNVVKPRDAADARILGATTRTVPAPVAANNRPAIIVAPGSSAGSSASGAARPAPVGKDDDFVDALTRNVPNQFSRRPGVRLSDIDPAEIRRAGEAEAGRFDRNTDRGAPDVAPPPVGQGDDFVDTLTRNVPNEFRRSNVIVPAGTDLAEVRRAGEKEAGRTQPDIAEAIAENIPAQFRRSAGRPATDSRRIQNTIRSSDGNDMRRSIDRVSSSPNAFTAIGN